MQLMRRHPSADLQSADNNFARSVELIKEASSERKRFILTIDSRHEATVHAWAPAAVHLEDDIKIVQLVALAEVATEYAE